MNLQKQRVDVPFALAATLTLLMPLLIPKLCINWFIPCLVIIIYRFNQQKAILLSFCTGALLDLLTDSRHLGIMAADYTLTTILLYPHKRHFFADKVSTMPMVTFNYSLLSHFILLPLLALFENRYPRVLSDALIDIFKIAAIDALYAFVASALAAKVNRKAAAH